MPTYVYECSRCEIQFEAQQRITEDPLDTCICGSKGTIKRVIQPIAVVFKGSGFHINDYAPKPGETKSSATAPSSEATAASSDSPIPDAPATAAPPASTESTPAGPAPSTTPSTSSE